MAPSFRLRRASVTVEELIATVARYLGEERTRESFASFALTRRIDLEPQAEADFQLLQYAEYLLASAIGAASSRLVLSLLLRKRTVSTKAALKLLDDANAAIHYNREILQTALDHVRQGIAVFDKESDAGLLEPAIRRDFRSAAWTDARRHRARRHSAPHRAQTARAGDDADAFIAERIAKYTSEAEPFLERFAERGLVIEVRSNRMPGRRPGHDLHRHYAERESGGGAGARQRDAGAPRARAHRRIDAAQRRTGARQGRSRRRQCFEDALRRRRKPRHFAAAQCRAALCHEPDRAPARPAKMRDLVHNIDASLEAVEEIFTALLDISRLDTGAMKPEIGDFRIDELLHRLEVEFAPLARAKGLDLVFMPCTLARALRPPAAAAAAAKPHLQRDQIYAGRPRAGRLPPPRRAAAHRSLRYRHRHSAGKRRAVFKEFHRLDQGARVARGVGLGLSIVERIARVLDCEVTLQSNVGQRLALFHRSAARDAVRRRCRNCAPCRGPMSAGSTAPSCSASTTSAPFSTAWRRCSAAGVAARSQPPISPKLWRRSTPADVEPDGFWSTITSTAATASPPSPNCAAASAARCRRS